MRQSGVLRRTIIAASVAGLLAAGGCGYHTVDSTRTHLPNSLHTIALPVFANQTQTPRLETWFTNAVSYELQTRAGLRVLRTDGPADATLRGTILTEQVTPLTYNSTTTQTSTSSYLVIITAKIELTDADHRVLYKNDRYQFRQTYESTEQLSSFIQEDTPARKRLARDFANAAVSDMLESF